MRWVRKTICIFLTLAMMPSIAWAEIPDYTVIIGNKSFALKYANDEKNIKEIRDALKNNTGEIVIKTKNRWFKNNGESFQEFSSLPRIIYTDQNGNKSEYEEGNGDKIKGEILSIDVVNGNIIRIQFTQKLDKQWINNRENFLVNGVKLTEKDAITYNEEKGYLEIKLHKKVENSVEVSMKNIKNQYGEVLYDEVKEKIVPKSSTSSNSGGSSRSGGSSNSGGSTNTTVKVRNIILNETELKMELPSEFQLTAEVQPNNATNKDLTWKSSDANVAIVDENGKVVAIGVGQAVITVEGADGISTQCNVKVINDYIELEEINLNKEELEIEFPGSFQLTSEILPLNATNKTLTWKSSDANVAIVDENGKVVAIGVGQAVITVKGANGVSKKCNVKVINDYIELEEINLNKEELEIEFPGEFQLTSEILPNNATNKDLTWKSSDANVATVDENGNVVAIGVGETVIIVEGADGVSKKCNVKVVNDYIEVEEINLNKEELEIEFPGEFQLTSEILPNNATNKALTWKSSDTNIATVDENGNVVAIGVGQAVIIVEGADGISTQCNVKVINDYIEVEKINLNKEELEIEFPGAFQLTSEILPSNATNKTLTWKSSDTSVATVDENGKVVADGVGEAVITVEGADGVSAQCNVTVVNDYIEVEYIHLNKDEIKIQLPGEFKLEPNFLPYDATNKSLTWKSSDSNVATVDENGKVVAVGLGEAVITGESVDGISASCNVTVIEKYIELEVKQIDFINYRTIRLIFDDDVLFKPQNLSSDINSSFKIKINDGKTYEANFVNDYGNMIDLGISKLELLEEDKIKKGSKVTVNYTAEGQEKIIANEKEVMPFEFEASCDKGFISVGNGTIEIKNDEFNGEIDNQNREVILYEDYDYWMDYIFTTDEVSGIAMKNSDLCYMVCFNGEIKYYDVIRKDMKLEFNMDEYKIGDYQDSISIDKDELITNTNNLEYKLKSEGDSFKLFNGDTHILLKSIKEGTGKILLEAQATRKDGSIIKGKIFRDELNVVINFAEPDKTDIEFTGIEISNYETINLKIDGKFDKNLTVTDQIEVYHNGIKCDTEIIINDYSLIIKLDNPYSLVESQLNFKYHLKKGDKFEIRYTANDNERLLVDGKEVNDFVRNIELDEEIESINGKNISIKDLTFNGEIDNEYNRIILFKSVTNEKIKDEILIPDGTELIFIGEGVHSQYVALVAQDGSNKLYTIVDKPITFAFESDNDETIKIGEEIHLNINNPSNLKYTFEIENDHVVDVKQSEDKLIVNGKRAGKTKIIIKGLPRRSDGTQVEGSSIIDEKTISVSSIPVDSVVLEKEKTIELGERLQLVAKIYPSNATNKNLTWSSSNPEIISVDENGILTARKLGTVIITAVSDNSKIATCVVNSVPRSNALFVNIINNKAVINIFDITGSEKIMLINIMNKDNGNLELIQQYELTSDKMEIELELDPGVYLGEINIVNSRRLKIKTFNID